MNLVYETKLGKLYHGDAIFSGEYIDINSLDLVFTDPPYPRQFTCMLWVSC